MKLDRSKKIIIAFSILIFTGVSFFCVKYFAFSPNGTAMSLKDVKSLPYLSYGTKKVDKSKVGVTKYRKALAYKGYNLYMGYLMDMKGNIINKWPNKRFIHLLNNGHIIAADTKRDKIGEYDWDSNVIWEKDFIVDHCLTLTDKDTILAITKEVHTYKGREVEFNVVVEFSRKGKKLARWSTYENLDYLKRFHRPSALDKPGKSKYAIPKSNPGKFGGEYDYYHMNFIDVLPKTALSIKDKRFQKENWLISLPVFDLVIILDRETEKVLWQWGPGKIEVQHHPRMLPNGNILIFDNGKRRKYSRVVEVNPVDKKIVWEYKGNPPSSFYTHNRGSAERLPNGNTLIVESSKGHAFEVTKEGKIVWEWFNPKINKEGQRKTIFSMRRISPEKINSIIHENRVN